MIAFMRTVPDQFGNMTAMVYLPSPARSMISPREAREFAGILMSAAEDAEAWTGMGEILDGPLASPNN